MAASAPERGWSGVAVSHGNDVARLGFGLRPWIHRRRGSYNGGVLARVRRLPFGPDAIDLRVVHPEDWVGRRGRDEAHGAADPDVPGVVHSLERRTKRVV